MINISSVSTGIKGLDKTLNYLQMGDNVVFQVENIEDYKIFVNPYVNDSSRKRTAHCLYALCPASAALKINRQNMFYMNLTPIPVLNLSLRRFIISSGRKDAMFFMYLIACPICFWPGRPT